MGRQLAWYALAILAVVVVGAVVVAVIKSLLGLIWYLLVGAVVVGGAVYLYGRAKGSIGGRKAPRIRR